MTSTGERRRGRLVVLSAPSGVGKTTVAKLLLRMDRRLVRAVTCTTRRPRRGEKDRRDYFFMRPRVFERMRRQGRFLEWARVHGHRYGTPARWALQKTRKGKDVLLVIDVKGGRAIKRRYPEAVLIFLRPPSFAVLRRRLVRRGSESNRDLRLRLRNARREMREGARYDRLVVNDRLMAAVRRTLRIIREGRMQGGK